ncbi:MAG: transposase [Desulfobacterales bacterium]|nr:transposase [Desulfobacterales bacterium]
MSDYPRILLEFQHLFPDETACARHLESIRRPEGFACPSCGQVGDPWSLRHIRIPRNQMNLC